MDPQNHFEATILAAGITCVYNADDWGRASDSRANDAGEDVAAESSAQH